MEAVLKKLDAMKDKMILKGKKLDKDGKASSIRYELSTLETLSMIALGTALIFELLVCVIICKAKEKGPLKMDFAQRRNPQLMETSEEAHTDEGHPEEGAAEEAHSE
jgi:hypothetical protein